MDTTAIVVLTIFAVVIVILAFRFRDRIRFGLKGPLGTNLDLEPQNPATDAARTGKGDPRAVACLIRSAPGGGGDKVVGIRTRKESWPRSAGPVSPFPSEFT
jgi:hypothetical protein